MIFPDFIRTNHTVQYLPYNALSVTAIALQPPHHDSTAYVKQSLQRDLCLTRMGHYMRDNILCAYIMIISAMQSSQPSSLGT